MTFEELDSLVRGLVTFDLAIAKLNDRLQRTLTLIAEVKTAAIAVDSTAIEDRLVTITEEAKYAAELLAALPQKEAPAG